MTRTGIVLSLLLLAASPAAAQQPPSAEQMQAMLAKMGPGPEHDLLRRLEGRWTQEVTLAGGGPQKVVVTGTATNRLILGGRFLLSERTADNPAGAAIGMPTIDAMNIYGFDRRTGEYTIIELDTMGTYWVSAAGAKQPGGAVVMSGETLDDHGGAREMRRFDMVLEMVDENTYTTRIVFKFPGKPDLTIAEAVFRRRK